MRCNEPEIEVVLVFDGRVVLIDLGGELIFEFLCFLEVGQDFLFFPELSVHSISDRRGKNKCKRPERQTEKLTPAGFIYAAVI